MRRTVSFLCLAAIALSTPALAADLPYLSECLEDPTYNAGFAALFRGERNLASWLQAYLKDRNGVDTPGKTLEDGRYELYQVCQPHNCPGNFIYTLFAPGGSKAWALLTTDGGHDRFFGNPNQPQRAMLTGAAQH